MHKLCNINIRKCQKISKRLNEFILKLKKRFNIKEIYLYGSFAKDEIHEGSDIDLIIVGDFKSPKMPKRIEEVLKLTDLPIEPLVYTSFEFEKMRRNNNPFIKEVIDKGKKL